MKFAGKTDIGRHRSENQDIFHILPFTERVVLATVCDGMGGAAGGKIASSLALSRFEASFVARLQKQNIDFTDKILPDPDILEEIIKEAVKDANRSVFSYAKDSVDLIGMGTTLVSCLVMDSLCLVCNVGDSRLYHLTKTSMRQITRDHSYVQMLIDTGMLSPQQAAAHPDRNVIMRAVGTRAVVTAETFRFTVAPDESLLLCSDGLSSFVSNEIIYSLVWGSESVFRKEEAEKVDAMIQAANDAGGRDNITAVLLTL